MTGDLGDLYQQVILDHGRNPRNFRALDPHTHHAEGFNPLCGDQCALSLEVEAGVITDAAFTGSGCAISTASASLLTEAVRGMTVAQADALFERVHDLLTTEAEPDLDALGKLQVFAGVRRFPMRVKCATLAWHTLESALHGGDVVSTE